MSNTATSFLRRTRIVCTIGPASGQPETMSKLMESGMDVARLNFAHGDDAQHAAYISLLRETAASLHRPLAILQDLPGPKDRTGRLREKQIVLKTGQEFVLTTRKLVGDSRRVSVGLASLAKDVKPGNTIFLADGTIKLEVLATNGVDIKCKVVGGGSLGENKGINVPGVALSTPSVTRRDWQQLDFGLAHGVDMIALSFVRESEDIVRVKDYLKKKRADQPVIAKIEKSEALQNLDAILSVADGIMVARGDLGVETAIERVPLVQKDIIKRCNRLGKPVIVATQMLESMVNSIRPTRAEVTDVANAIFDGTDAVMLSEETAAGKYPVESVMTMAQVAFETDRALPYELIMNERGREYMPHTDDAIAFAACRIAVQIGARAIVAFTSSGSTARRVARYRPQVPILAMTSSESVWRRLSLLWGVRAYQVPAARTISELFAQGARVARETGVAGSGDMVVVTGGVPVGVRGSTNLVKVETV